MRYRRRRGTLTPKQERFADLMDRSALRADALSSGIGESLKHCGNEKDCRVLLDMINNELLPEFLHVTRYYNIVYPARGLRARTRKTLKPRKKAQKSANGKKKTV